MKAATLIGTFLVVVIPSFAVAEMYVDTFATVPPEGGWFFGQADEGVVETGGNPDEFLHTWYYEGIAPAVMTTNPDSVFAGNFYERQVHSMGLDARVFYADYPVGNRPMTLLLFSDNDTPGDYQDDWCAFNRGENIPSVDEGWTSYDYDIPYDATEFPEDWHYFPWFPEAPETGDWQMLMRNVSNAMFEFCDPELYYVLQAYEVGVDNMRVSWAPEPTSLALLGFGTLFLRRRF